jgi:hypothetical protein
MYDRLLQRNISLCRSMATNLNYPGPSPTRGCGRKMPIQMTLELTPNATSSPVSESGLMRFALGAGTMIVRCGRVADRVLGHERRYQVTDSPRVHIKKHDGNSCCRPDHLFAGDDFLGCLIAFRNHVKPPLNRLIIGITQGVKALINNWLSLWRTGGSHKPYKDQGDEQPVLLHCANFRSQRIKCCSIFLKLIGKLPGLFKNLRWISFGISGEKYPHGFAVDHRCLVPIFHEKPEQLIKAISLFRIDASINDFGGVFVEIFNLGTQVSLASKRLH